VGAPRSGLHLAIKEKASFHSKQEVIYPACARPAHGKIAVPAASSGHIQHARFTEPAALATATPGVVMDVTPLRHEGFFVDLLTVRLGDLVLIRGACSPLLLVATPGPATVALQFPMEHADALVLNGRLLPPFGFCLYGPGTQLVRSSTKDATYAVLVMAPEVAETHLAAEDGRPGIGPGEHVMRSARAEDWNRMERLIRSATDVAREAPEIFASEQPRLALRSSLLGIAREIVSTATGAEAAVRRRSPTASTRVVLGAEAYLNAHLDRPIYTDELCRVLGVSPATLGEAFHSALGISPHRYLKLRRLNMVRAALLRHERAPQPLVKSVALAHGFWHLGQFSRDYRDHFGEAPSRTLAGANGNEPTTDGGSAEPDSMAVEIAQRAARTR
jgi:AraC family ethanolamine operon transcriptional activator